MWCGCSWRRMDRLGEEGLACSGWNAGLTGGRIAEERMDEGEFGRALEGRLLMVLDVDVAPPLDLGSIGGVGERVVALTGGRVSGPYRGRIVPGGSDWQQAKPDGTLEIRARYVAELEEG